MATVAGEVSTFVPNTSLTAADYATAIAFGYFETLIRLGDTNKFYEELARLRSLSNVINLAGFDVDIFEDFANETYDLLKKLPQVLNVGNAEDVLLETFNDESVQNYIITHLRVCFVCPR